MIPKNKKPSLLRRVLKWAFRSIALLILILLLWSSIPIKPTISSLKPRADTRYWTLKDGHKIAFTKLNGDSAEKNPAIIFLHGGPGGYIHSATIDVMKVIAAIGYDVYLYDQIGSGLSNRLPKPKDYSFQRHVNDLNEIITSQLDTRKVVLIGHSFGGILATHYTAHHPQNVAQLILSSPGDLQPQRENNDRTGADLTKLYPTPSQYLFKKPIEVFEQTEKDFLQPRIVMSMLCAMAFNRRWASDKEFDDYTNTMASKFTKGMVADPKNVKPEEGGAGGYSHGFSNYYGNVVDVRPKLKQLNIPTLVLQGQYDQGEYSSVYEYADLLKGKYQFIENAGHIIWWDKPREYTTAIIKFLIEGKADSR